MLLLAARRPTRPIRIAADTIVRPGTLVRFGDSPPSDGAGVGKSACVSAGDGAVDDGNDLWTTDALGRGGEGLPLAEACRHISVSLQIYRSTYR